MSAAYDGALRQGLRRLSLFGTRFTMCGAPYPAVFGALIKPTAGEQEFIHDKSMNELLKNRFTGETRHEFERIIVRLRDEEGMTA